MSTRQQIVTELKKYGPLTSSQLAQRLGVSPTAVRQHLAALGRDDLVTSETVRRGVGRPTQLHRLTPQGHELFPRKYADFTILLLEELIKDQGEESLHRLLQRLMRRQESLLRPRLNAKDMEERLTQLTAVLEENGSMTEWTETSEGYQFIEHHCPIYHVAKKFPQICFHELKLLRRLLGVPLHRASCMAEGGSRCTYLLSHNSAAEKVAEQAA